MSVKALKIAVLIPIYNGERDIEHLIPALARQQHALNQVEFLFVDNRSTDNTQQAIEDWIRSEALCGFHVLKEERVQSSYAARNSGIRSSESDIIVFTDSDCRPHEEWLAKLVGYFEEPKVDIVVGQILPVPPGTAVEKYSIMRGLLRQQRTLNHEFRPYGQTANLAVRRSVFETIGLFRPNLRSGGDADICWRAQEAGFRARFADDAIVFHQHRVNMRELWKQYNRYAVGGVYLQNLYGYPMRRPPSYLTYLLAEWTWNTARYFRRAIRERDPEYLLFSVFDLIRMHAHKSGSYQAMLEKITMDVEFM